MQLKKHHEVKLSTIMHHWSRN